MAKRSSSDSTKDSQRSRPTGSMTSTYWSQLPETTYRNSLRNNYNLSLRRGMLLRTDGESNDLTNSILSMPSYMSPFCLSRPSPRDCAPRHRRVASIHVRELSIRRFRHQSMHRSLCIGRIENQVYLHALEACLRVNKARTVRGQSWMA